MRKNVSFSSDGAAVFAEPVSALYSAEDADAVVRNSDAVCCSAVAAAYMITSCGSDLVCPYRPSAVQLCEKVVEHGEKFGDCKRGK